MFLKELTHLNKYLKLWFQLNTCMLHIHYVHEVLFGFVFNWTTFGLWFCKLIFETCHIMSFKVFSRKLAQKDRIWCFKSWFWAWRFNLEIPDFGSTLERGTPRSSVHFEFMQFARAGKVTLEREMRVSSTLHVFTVRSSEGMHARAKVERPSSVNCMHPVLLPEFAVRLS